MSVTALAPAIGDLVGDCEHPLAQHHHGTHAAYVHDRCRCPHCRAATAAYERNRHRQRAYGRQAFVDAGPARAHVLGLMSGGMGLKRVAQLANVSSATLGKLIYGSPGTGKPPTARIRPATQAALMGIRGDRLAGGAYVNATGTHRRLQALVAAGWSMAELARRSGIDPTNLPAVLQRPQVRVRTRDLVASLYEDLAYVVPAQETPAQKYSATRARNHAAAHAWHGPAAWFAVDIDNPATEPDLDGIRHPGHRNDNNAVVEDLEWILSAGGTWDEAPHRTGLKTDALDQRLRRAGRGDLISALKRTATTQTTQPVTRHPTGRRRTPR